MGKNKKKRNKKYSGSNAAKTEPTIIKIEAVNRNKLAQWWFDHKRIGKPVLIGLVILFFIIIIVDQILRLAR